MSYFIKPILVDTKTAHELVGGSRVWKELLEKHPDILVPTRVLERGDAHWRYDTIEKACLIAETTGTLIHETQLVAVCKKHGKHYKRAAPEKPNSEAR